jgi:Ala-tRNA(Pro) deacylase
MPPADIELRVLEALERLGIPFVRHEHPPVFTVEEAEVHWRDVRGTHCKNLFLRNNKGNRHYLVVAEASRQVDLKALTRALGDDRLSFGSPERLMKHLGLTPGAVSPFGIMNNAAHDVRVVVDAGLKTAERLAFHPNVNTATLEIARPDFEKFLAQSGNPVRWIEL